MSHFFRAAFCLFTLVITFNSVTFADGNPAKGKVNFDKLCAQCHGTLGAGDGPVGASLPPNMKPADMTKAQFKFVTDLTKFTELLHKGGAAVGLNPLMSPQASLSDQDIADLYAYVQSLKK